MRDSFDRAIRNIAEHGDTDIFPYPIENLVLFDKKEEIVEFLNGENQDFDRFIANYPPSNYGALAPVGYTGFRWATQIDPLWNVYFLALVIELAEKIESVRIPVTDNCVFSYRFNPAHDSAALFKRDIGWRQFVEAAVELAKSHKFVISCDISEFYPRLNHHRLDNALRQLPGGTNVVLGSWPSCLIFLKHTPSGFPSVVRLLES